MEMPRPGLKTRTKNKEMFTNPGHRQQGLRELVTTVDPWADLISYCLDSWHNPLAEEEASGDVMDTSDDAHLNAANASTGSLKPPQFKLNTLEGHGAFIEWCLQTAASRSFAFH
ncbi:hypothetical protein K438DRAFT_2000781 [Mycena galopus ATCC 62051]|nr:hypothetical protein K438DRAFT_2000781 [Mycena galopus ATCC 62051]